MIHLHLLIPTGDFLSVHGELLNAKVFAQMFLSIITIAGLVEFLATVTLAIMENAVLLAKIQRFIIVLENALLLVSIMKTAVDAV